MDVDGPLQHDGALAQHTEAGAVALEAPRQRAVGLGGVVVEEPAADVRDARRRPETRGQARRDPDFDVLLLRFWLVMGRAG